MVKILKKWNYNVELDSNVKFPLLRLLHFLSDLKSTILHIYVYQTFKIFHFDKKLGTFSQYMSSETVVTILEIRLYICNYLIDIGTHRRPSTPLKRFEGPWTINKKETKNV